MVRRRFPLAISASRRLAAQSRWPVGVLRPGRNQWRSSLRVLVCGRFPVVRLLSFLVSDWCSSL